MRICMVCPTHGFQRTGGACPVCVEESMRSNTININPITHSWVSQGEWEHIDPRNPHLRFNNKKELIDYCKKMSNSERDLIPKAFMKPKSQGKGDTYS